MKSRLRQWIESLQAAVCGLTLGVAVTAAMYADSWQQFLVNLAVFTPLAVAMAWLFWRRHWRRKGADQDGGQANP